MSVLSIDTLIEYTYMVIRTGDKDMRDYTIDKLKSYISAADRLLKYLTIDDLRNRPDIFNFADIITAVTSRANAVKRLRDMIENASKVTTFESLSHYVRLEPSPKFNLELHLNPLMQLTKYALEMNNREIGHVLRKDIFGYTLWLGEVGFSLYRYIKVEPLLCKNVIDNFATQISLIYLLYDTLGNAFSGSVDGNLRDDYDKKRNVLPEGWAVLYEISMKRMHERVSAHSF
jgi:hypothetical protein